MSPMVGYVFACWLLTSRASGEGLPCLPHCPCPEFKHLSFSLFINVLSPSPSLLSKTNNSGCATALTRRNVTRPLFTLNTRVLYTVCSHYGSMGAVNRYQHLASSVLSSLLSIVVLILFPHPLSVSCFQPLNGPRLFAKESVSSFETVNFSLYLESESLKEVG